MKTTLSAMIGGAVLFGASLGMSAAASATIVNISALSSTPATPAAYTFTPGSYRIEWIGVADGGAYDGYNLACPGGICPASGWRADFQVYAQGAIPTPTPDVHLISLFAGGKIKEFGSALDALNAYKSAPVIVDVTIPAPYTSASGFVLINQPWIIDVDELTNVYFFNPEDARFRFDNVGGVSLRITALSVPEPSTWALMISGFGLAGLGLRRRRMVAAV